MFDIKKASGDPAFDLDVKEAIVKEKDGTDELVIMAVVNRRMEPTSDSKPVCVGRKGVPDKVCAGYYDEGSGEDEEIAANLDKLANEFVTKPFKNSQ